MVTNPAPRGPRRRFSLDEAVATGQEMFHIRGYDGVGLAELTEALAVKPPSFYAAFGSKAEFFERVLDRYSASVLPLKEILRPERPTAEALADLLLRAARSYTRDPRARGCLALEASRGDPDSAAVQLARKAVEERRDAIHAFVAREHPDRADLVTDFVASTMSGLSASARHGLDEARLLGIAGVAIAGLRLLLAEGAAT